MEPLALFRLLAVHEDLFGRMRALGAGLLGHPRLTVQERELLILRTTARCGAHYEWGVHVTAFGRQAAGLTEAQIRSTAVGGPDCGWYRLLGQVINAADLGGEPWAEPFPT